MERKKITLEKRTILEEKSFYIGFDYCVVYNQYGAFVFTHRNTELAKL